MFRTLFLACMMPFVLVAQQTQLDEVVVASPRIELPFKENSRSLRVITTQDIVESAATTLVDVLRFQAGIDLRSRGMQDTQSDIYIRGGGFDQVLLLIDGIKVDDRGATNLPGVWAAGDVTGQAWLAHAASRMAEVVVNNISGQTDQMRHDSMPAVVYTSPEVAVVGLTKEEAEERGIKTRTGRIPMAINARYIAENPDEGGLCKVVLEDGTNRLLGVHMVGGACSEMIFGATAMIETELREEEIDEIVFPHPTTSEIMKDVFMAVR